MSSSHKGQCPACQQENDYSKVVCDFCGSRLPWAAALTRPAPPIAPTQPAPAQIPTKKAPYKWQSHSADRPLWMIGNIMSDLGSVGFVALMIWLQDLPKEPPFQFALAVSDFSLKMYLCIGVLILGNALILTDYLEYRKSL